MSKPTLLVAITLLTVVGACRTDNPGGDDEPAVDARPDASNDGCSAMSPRSVAPETFVGPTGLQNRMNELFDGAQQTLDIHMYLWTVRSLADRVVAAKNRGVQVRIILDPDQPGNDNVKPTFVANSVPMRTASTLYTYSHAKYIIVDGQKVAIMSMNFNVDAMNNERNYGMIDRDPDDVSDVQGIFDQDWAMAGGEPSNPAELACTRLVVSPTNSKTRLLELIGSAQSTLEVEVIYLAETTVRQAIVDAKARGVNVRVLIGDTSDDAIPLLKAAGIPVKYSNEFYLHAKLIVADGVVFVGSENMSFTSLTKNREVGALVFEPSATEVITSQFTTDWNGATSL